LVGLLAVLLVCEEKKIGSTYLKKFVKGNGLAALQGRPTVVAWTYRGFLLPPGGGNGPNVKRRFHRGQASEFVRGNFNKKYRMRKCSKEVASFTAKAGKLGGEREQKSGRRKWRTLWTQR